MYMFAGTWALLLYFFPVTLPIVALWICGLVKSARQPTPLPGSLAGWCLLPAAFTAGEMVIGVVFAGTTLGVVEVVATILILGLVVAHIPLGVVLARRAGAHGLLVIASSIAWCWTSAWAAFVALMAVSNNWL